MENCNKRGPWLLVRILDWHHVAWCVKTWALTTLNMSIIKSSANLQNPPFSLQMLRENHRDRSSEVQKSWIAQIFWPGIAQFVLTRRKSVSSISFWWQVQFPLVTNYWRRGPNQDETRLSSKPVQLDYRLVIFLPGKLFVMTYLNTIYEY